MLANARCLVIQQVIAINAGGSTGWRKHAHHQIQKRRLAAGIATGNADDFTRLDMKRYIFEQRRQVLAVAVLSETEGHIFQGNGTLYRRQFGQARSLFDPHGKDALQSVFCQLDALEPCPDTHRLLQGLHGPARQHGTGSKATNCQVTIDHIGRAEADHGKQDHLGKEGSGRLCIGTAKRHIMFGLGTGFLQALITANHLLFHGQALNRMNPAQNFDNEAEPPVVGTHADVQGTAQFFTNHIGDNKKSDENNHRHQKQKARQIGDGTEIQHGKRQVPERQQGLTGIIIPEHGQRVITLEMRASTLFFKVDNRRTQKPFNGGRACQVIKAGTHPAGHIGTTQSQQGFQYQGDANADDQQDQGSFCRIGDNAVINLQQRQRHRQRQDVDKQRSQGQVELGTRHIGKLARLPVRLRSLLFIPTKHTASHPSPIRSAQCPEHWRQRAPGFPHSMGKGISLIFRYRSNKSRLKLRL